MKQFHWRLITHLWKWYFLWIYAYKISYKIIRCIRKLFNSICVMKFLRISEKNWIRLPNAEISYSKVPISIKDLGFCTFYQIFINQFFFGCSQRAWITWNSFTSSIPYLSSLWYRKALIDQLKMSSVILIQILNGFAAVALQIVNCLKPNQFIYEKKEKCSIDISSILSPFF